MRTDGEEDDEAEGLEDALDAEADTSGQSSLGYFGDLEQARHCRDGRGGSFG